MGICARAEYITRSRSGFMKTEYNEKQVKAFAKSLKKGFKESIDLYVYHCFKDALAPNSLFRAKSKQRDIEEAEKAFSSGAWKDESCRIMMRAAMLAYMKAGMHMKGDEIKTMIRNLEIYHGNYYFRDRFSFINYSLFDEQVYWAWVQKRLELFMGEYQNAWKGIE